MRIPFVGIYHESSAVRQGYYSGSDRVEVTAVSFPRPGTFAYQVDSQRTPITVDMSGIDPRPEMLKEPGTRPVP